VATFIVNSEPHTGARLLANFWVGGGGVEEDEEDETEGDEVRDAAPHGPHRIDPTDPATRNSFPTWAK
jgi:hypothetical protein